MSDWNKFNAWMRDRTGKKHSPPVFPVIVWGVTRETAMDKLIAEYPASQYEIVSFDPATDPLSNPNSFKGAKGPNDT